MEGPWINDKPHGLCIFEGEDLRGVGTFTHGELHGGPYWNEYISAGVRVTLESTRYGERVGIRRLYHSDKQSCVVNDK